MSDKVQGGTPKSALTLCRSCQHGVCVSGFNLREHIHCGYVGKSVEFPIFTCTKYAPGTTASLQEMHKIAWVIESRNRGPWGFSGENQREIVVRPPGEQPEQPTQGPIGRERDGQQATTKDLTGSTGAAKRGDAT